MKKLFKIVCVVILFFTFAHSHAAEKAQPIQELKCLADALNIEGGIIARKYLRSGQIWANLCVVLDRPFEDGKEWDEITQSNCFPLKEASLSSYNEAHVNLAYAMILHYYVQHAHRLSGKEKNEEATLLVQVHRNSSGAKQVELLEQLLCECWPELKRVKRDGDATFSHELFTYYFPELNVKVQFCYGTLPRIFAEAKKYEKADIVLSYSLVAGLNPEWQSGTLLIPRAWVPICLGTMEVNEGDRYSVQNHLSCVLDEILLGQNQAFIEVINAKFRSLNPVKYSQMATWLSKMDFKSATLLQVDGMFNPSKLGQEFKKIK